MTKGKKRVDLSECIDGMQTIADNANRMIAEMEFANSVTGLNIYSLRQIETVQKIYIGTQGLMTRHNDITT